MGHIITVANCYDCDLYVDANNLNVGSNYGDQVVDLAAIGMNVPSTGLSVPYGRFGPGTSFSTAYVTGVAALIKSEYPYLTRSQIKDAIMFGVNTITSLQDKVISGGRLNACYALIKAGNINSGYTFVVNYDSNSCGNATGFMYHSLMDVTDGICPIRENDYTYNAPGKSFRGWTVYNDISDKWLYSNRSGKVWLADNEVTAGYYKVLLEDEEDVCLIPHSSNDVITLYAQWDPLEYTIDFDPSGMYVSGTMNSLSSSEGQSFNLPSNQFSKTWCQFDGWTVSTDNGYYLVNNGSSNLLISQTAYNTNPNLYTRVVYNDGALFTYSPDYPGMKLVFSPVWTPVLGDVNLDGVIDDEDRVLAAQSVDLLVTLTPSQFAQADVNQDGVVNIIDVSAIQTYISGLM